MKIVAQIVKDATITVNEEVISNINYGLLLLVSFTHGDTLDEVNYLADKVLKMRVFPDENDKTNLSVTDLKAEILSVSQFTLFGDLKSRRPSFTNVLSGQESIVLYEAFNAKLGAKVNVATGVFGAKMNVKFTNIGPVTYILDSDER